MKTNSTIFKTILLLTATLVITCGDNKKSNASNQSNANATQVEEKVELEIAGVTYGGKVWTIKNLDVKTYRNGDVIPQVQDEKVWSNLSSGAWCYYDNDTSCGTKYGKLYNWYAINDPRGLAPNGYHIPTDSEWTELTDYLGGADNGVGIKMKSLSGWNTYGNGTNNSGFSGFPGGSRNSNGSFSCCEGDRGDWWSSTADERETRFWGRRLSHGFGYVLRSTYEKREGLSVRCIKD